MVILSFCLFVRPSVHHTQYRFKTRWDRDFGFLPHDSLQSLIVCDKISCCLGEGGHPKQEGEKWAFASLTSTPAVKAFARGRHATSSLFSRDWKSVFVYKLNWTPQFFSQTTERISKRFGPLESLSNKLSICTAFAYPDLVENVNFD